MSRVLRLRYYGRRQREVVLGLIGSSAAVGIGAWHLQRPLLADAGEFAGAKTWSERQTVVSQPRHISDPPPGQAPKSIKGRQTPPPPQTKGHSTSDAGHNVTADALSAWDETTSKVAAVCDSFTGWDFNALRTKITDAILPLWIRVLPGYLDKLRNEISGAPWSLAWEIWEDAHDPSVNPEIIWDATVRISQDLCLEEQSFLDERRTHVTKALARYLGVPEDEVHPEDVPVIGLCGSGGGLRALVAGASSSLCAQESGLFDCITYTAGVSGSCWLQTLYNSSIGQQNYARIIDHLKERIGIHIAYPPAALALLSSAPTNKFLLSGYVEKLRGVPDADFGAVDIYGLLLAARLLIPKGELRIDDNDLKVSNQRFAVAEGKAPLPIYTAVRHEIPKHMEDHLDPSKAAWQNAKHYAWFQWFEWTPYEFFCEDLECGIPTWAMGRRWQGGNTVWRENGLALPELRVPLLLGIWGSAFCATLSHYYKEIRPILSAAGLSSIDTLLHGKDDDLVKVHPIDPAVIPNFALGLRERLPQSCPDSIHEAQHLQLMDAGMSNNLPIYPLLRPGRNVDIILAFDASADVKTDNWIKVADGYARRRGIKGWPMGAGWPSKANEQQRTIEELDIAQAANAQKIDDLVREPSDVAEQDGDLGYCNVWVGTTQEQYEYMDDAPTRRFLSSTDEKRLASPSAGITLIYFPLVANEKVTGVDPLETPFLSTWNFVYTPDEIDKVVALARANFEEGKEQTRRTIRAVWQRKKSLRLQKMEEEREFRSRQRLISKGRDEAIM